MNRFCSAFYLMIDTPQVASRIKDGMREQCLPAIVDAWHSILLLHDSAHALVASCLHTIHLYISWIDISLVANRRFLELFLQFLHQPMLHEGTPIALVKLYSSFSSEFSKCALSDQAPIFATLCFLVP